MKRIGKIVNHKKQSVSGIVIGILLCACLMGCSFIGKKDVTTKGDGGSEVTPTESVTPTPSPTSEQEQNPTPPIEDSKKPEEIRKAIIDILLEFHPYDRECLSPDIAKYQETLAQLAQYGKVAPYYMAEYVLNRDTDVKSSDIAVLATELMKSENMLDEAGSYCLYDSEYEMGCVKWYADQMRKFYADKYRDVIPEGTTIAPVTEKYYTKEEPTELITEYSQEMDNGDKTYPELSAKQAEEWLAVVENYKELFHTESRNNLMEILAYYRVIDRENATFPVVIFVPEGEVDKLPNGDWQMLGWMPVAELSVMGLYTPRELLENRWYAGNATAKQMEELMTNFGRGSVRLLADAEVNDPRIPDSTAQLDLGKPELTAMFFEYWGDAMLQKQDRSIVQIRGSILPQ